MGARRCDQDLLGRRALAVAVRVRARSWPRRSRAHATRAPRPGWGKIVAAEAADGHQAIFSASEVDPDAGPTRSYLVWLEDGQPLPAKDGPFRLVTPTDKRGFRSVRQLTTLRVVVARGSSR